MKKIATALFLAPALSQAALIWSENFETIDIVSFDNVEDQTGGDWLTSPIADPAAAVLANDTLVASLGTQSLYLGGLAPAGAATTVASAYSPLTASYAPTLTEPAVLFSTYLYFDPNGQLDLTDSFSLSFYDQNDDSLASVIFTASATSGFVSIYRDNIAAQFDTSVIVANNAAVRMDFLIDLSLNKWTGTLTPDGTTTVINMFADVTFTENAGVDTNSLELGSFGFDWVKETGSPTWGDNFIVADNITLTSVPEPSAALLGGFGLLALASRRRRS